MSLLIFETIEHETAHVPAAQLAYWTLTRTGTLTLYPCGGPPLRPMHAALVLDQLLAVGLLPAPQPVTPPAAPVPEPVTPPTPPTAAPRKARRRATNGP